MPDKKVLIIILLLLASVRVVFIPWLDHQDELTSQLDADTGRLERYYSVLENTEQLQSSLTSLQARYQELTSALRSEKSHTAVSLLLQNEWFPLLEKNKVVLDYFNWQGQVLIASPEIYNATIVVKLSGAFVDVVRLQSELQSMNQTLRVTSVEYYWRADVGVVADIRVELLYRVHNT